MMGGFGGFVTTGVQPAESRKKIKELEVMVAEVSSAVPFRE